MAYDKNVSLYNQLKQDLGSGIIEVEFVLEDQAPKVEEKPKKTIYKLSAPVSRKSLRKDRKSRKKSHISFERPVSSFSVAESRMTR